MNDTHDYYALLHVQHDAPVEIIRSSYRTLMQQLKRHPDLGGDHANACLINQAYATLTNSEKRAEYDRTRSVPPRSENSKSPDRESGTDSAVTYLGSVLGQCVFCKAMQRSGEAAEVALCNVCMSPLCRAKHHAVPASGRRSFERFSKQQPIRFYTAWPDHPISGYTLDISLRGMQFDTTVQLALNQLIKVDCDACRAIARVAHAEQVATGWVVGVEFVTVRFERVQGTFVQTDA